MTAELVRQATDEHARSGDFQKAAQLYKQMMTSADFPEFLTLSAYEYLD